MRTVISLSGSALALVLGTGPAGALSDDTEAGLEPEQVCQANKLEATTRYHRCVTYAYRKPIVRDSEPPDDRIARCDHRCDRAFERAEDIGGCASDGSPSRDSIKAQVHAGLAASTLRNPCASHTIAEGLATCTLSTSESSIDLVKMLKAFDATPDSIIWIQAWGGNGADGSQVDVLYAAPGTGGAGGYAQTVTTLDDIAIRFNDASTLYYYLGYAGNKASSTPTGGDGGTATFVTTEDANQGGGIPSQIVLAAGGGGGGGAASDGGGSCSDPSGYGGGIGAVAIAKPSEDVTVSGEDGWVSGVSGAGGKTNRDGGSAGGSAEAGDPVFAPLGGVGGGNRNSRVGFFNAEFVGHGGTGGSPGDGNAGGGGGGGGYSGGGGGAGAAETKSGHCRSGGGGGGSSLASGATATCSAAPTAMPPNPNGKMGYVQIVIDVGGC